MVTRGAVRPYYPPSDATLQIYLVVVVAVYSSSMGVVVVVVVVVCTV